MLANLCGSEKRINVVDFLYLPGGESIHGIRDHFAVTPKLHPGSRIPLKPSASSRRRIWRRGTNSGPCHPAGVPFQYQEKVPETQRQFALRAWTEYTFQERLGLPE